MTDDVRLQRWLNEHRNAVAAHPSDDHIDMDTLTRHAAGQLSDAKARMVSEHLLACDDGRCGAFVRSQAADIDAAGDLLSAERQALGEQSHERTFQSREIIWSTFESMARELAVPIDDLVNEAMAAYARVRGYSAAQQPALSAATQPLPLQAPSAKPSAVQMQMLAEQDHDGGPAHGRDPLEETHDAPSASALDRSYAPPRSPAGTDDDDDLARTAAQKAFTRVAAGRPATSEPGEFADETRTIPRRPAVQVPAALSRPVMGLSGPPPARSEARTSRTPAGGPPPLPPRLAPPKTQRMPDAPVRESSAPGTKRLLLTYQGRPHAVEKDRFLIGRSKTQADLRLDDPNVSRQHAVIERVGAAWYIVDLGSTNGVNVAGERVSRRALSDGDLIVITSHEIRCSLR